MEMPGNVYVLPDFVLDLIFFLGTVEFPVLVGCVVVCLAARGRVSSARAGGARPAASGMTGAGAVAAVLREAGVVGVRVVAVGPYLADHYDPAGRVVRLSEGVSGGRTVASLGIACHVAGHALRHAAGSRGLAFPNGRASAAGIGSALFWLVLAAGLTLRSTVLIAAAVRVLAGNLAVQLAGLPDRRGAGRAAGRLAESAGVVAPGEAEAFARVLDAAALARVAEVLVGAPGRLRGAVRGCSGRPAGRPVLRQTARRGR